MNETKPIRAFGSSSAATNVNWCVRHCGGDRLGDVSLVQAGSSLKFCRVAEGEADIYPRLAPTCEWDTAAAQAVLEGAGGVVVDLQGAPLLYGKPDVLNPSFIATRDTALIPA